jgi:hypothetical protein
MDVSCIYTYIHTYMHTCIHAYMHTYIHTCIHAYIHTYHTYIRIYMHTYIHTYRVLLISRDRHALLDLLVQAIYVAGLREFRLV